MDKYRIPQTLDEPLKIALWTMDEVLAFIIPTLVLVIAYNQFLLGSAIGMACMYVLKKIKGEQGHYYIFNVMYWHLPPIVHFKSTPPSHLRHFIG